MQTFDSLNDRKDWDENNKFLRAKQEDAGESVSVDGRF